MSRRVNTRLQSRLEADRPLCDGSTEQDRRAQLQQACAAVLDRPIPATCHSASTSRVAMQDPLMPPGSGFAQPLFESPVPAAAHGAAISSAASESRQLQKEELLRELARVDAELAAEDTLVNDTLNVTPLNVTPRGGVLRTKLGLLRAAREEGRVPAQREEDVTAAFSLVQTAIEVGASPQLVRQLVDKAERLAADEPTPKTSPITLSPTYGVADGKGRPRELVGDAQGKGKHAQPTYGVAAGQGRPEHVDSDLFRKRAPSRDPPEAPAQVVDITKIKIPPFKCKTAEEGLNWKYLLDAALDRANCKDHAYSNSGTQSQDKLLNQIVTVAIADCDEVITDVRTKFGSDASGFDLYAHIRSAFIEPLVNELSNAEQDLIAFDWDKVFSGDGRRALSSMNQLWAIVMRLDQSRRGTAQYWVKEILKKMPTDLHSEYLRVLNEKDANAVRAAASDITAFSRVLSEAVNSKHLRAQQRERDGRSDFGVNAHSGGNNRPPPASPSPSQCDSMLEKILQAISKIQLPGSNEKPTCAKCGARACPLARKPTATCDVFGDPDETRIKEIAVSPSYQERVDQKRAKNGRPVINYDCKPCSSSHSFVEQGGAQGAQNAEMALINAQMDFYKSMGLDA